MEVILGKAVRKDIVMVKVCSHLIGHRPAGNIIAKFIFIACDNCRKAGNDFCHPEKTNRRFDSKVYHLTMSMCPVRIEFNCENTFNTLSYVHDLPRSLVPVDSTVIPRESEYAVLLQRAVWPILKRHEVACQAASSPQCGVCGSTTEQILQTPISIIQDIGHPFLSVWVHSVCGKAECEALTRNGMDRIMGRLRRQFSDEMRSEAKGCKMCGKTEGMKRCARCKAVVYCGIENQKADWKRHKRFCESGDREDH